MFTFDRKWVRKHPERETDMSSQLGRPSKSDGPAFPHDEVDQLLVHGEAMESASGVGTEMRYPSYRELAKRYGVAHSLIAKFAKAHNCLARRQQAAKRVKDLADTKLIELRADHLAMTRDDAVRVIDRYIAQFEEALTDGRVRSDNPSDFNLMLRLKSFIMGDADSRHELLGGITLDDLQQRHQAMLRQWEESTPEMRGEEQPALGGGGDAGDASDDSDNDDGDDGLVNQG